MSVSHRDQLIGDVARRIVAQAAPEELPLFRSLYAAYLRDPEAVLQGKTSTGGPLGFGGGGADIALLAPVAMVVTQSVVTLLISEGSKAAAAEGAGFIDRWVKALFERKKEESPALTPEQLARIHELADQKALQLGLPPEKAALLADAMVGSLAIEHDRPS